MNPEESEVFDLLVEAWNKFVKLPIQHPIDQQDFQAGIRSLQNLLLARCGVREMGWSYTSDGARIANVNLHIRHDSESDSGAD